MEKRAIILLSGGLDSTTCFAIALEQGYSLFPITFYYNQRHCREVENARKIASYYEVTEQHKIVDVSFLGELGMSSLTDRTLSVRQSGVEEDIPTTYVPARNLIFLSMATAYAEVKGAIAIFTGVSAVDYSGYPDCRPEFIRSLTETIILGTKLGVTSESKMNIQTPLIHMNKAETIKRGIELGVPYHLTTSCYLGEEEACGKCDSCHLRLKGFQENGFEDPICYKKIPEVFGG
jgi:7-cyano-7-deazaguanine synthase